MNTQKKINKLIETYKEENIELACALIKSYGVDVDAYLTKNYNFLLELTGAGDHRLSIKETLPNVPYRTKLANTFSTNREIPNCVWDLKNIDNIFFHGMQIKKIDKRITNFKKLMHLNIYESNLEEVPNFLINLKNLLSVSFNENNLCAIPYHLSSLPKMNILNLSSNKITNIDDEIIKFQNLKVLRLNGNNIVHISRNILKLPNLNLLTLTWHKNIEAVVEELRNVNKHCNIIYRKI